MFKLESYITPLLLSYVDKYIKNLKPEDSQVSLWGGDAVFNNLDLRLDVLEQELRLPFNFVNGHIHELRIHVPWTKLTSEPVIITINTIECVLKLCEGCDSSIDEVGSVRSSSGFKIRGEPKYTRKRPDIDIQPGIPPNYIQSLINRVINNIKLICNNVVLKYVEDDIVLSLNVKSVEASSADHKWNEAFVDLTFPDLILRKLIKLQDLTVCLDRRNASGKISTYQDPLLYRCSLDCRLFMAFESLHARHLLSTKLDILCDQLDFSVTDHQLPMFLRLIELCLALHANDIPYPTLKPEDADTSEAESGEIMSSEMVHQNEEEGWGAWMWSYIPVGFSGWTQESASAATPASHLPSSVFHMGFFIKKASFIFKATAESIEPSISFNALKVTFQPLISLKTEGVFITFVMRGIDAFNVQMGITFIGGFITGNCPCGVQDNVESNAASKEATFFIAGDENADGNHLYFAGSLFDNESPENCGHCREYCFDWDEHFAQVSNVEMQKKTPAFALDYFYLMDIPEDVSDKSSGFNAYDLQCGNLGERAVNRIIVGPSELNIHSSIVHRLIIIINSALPYEYEPYSKVNRDVINDALSQPTSEEIAVLESNVPSRSVTVLFIKPTIKLFIANHPYFDGMDKIKNLRKKSKLPSMKASISEVPVFITCADIIDVHLQCVMYPLQVVKTTCMITLPSGPLLNNSYTHLHIKIISCESFLTYNLAGDEIKRIIVQPCNLSVHRKRLLLPCFWKNDMQPLYEVVWEFPLVKFFVTTPQIMLFSCFFNSWWNSNWNLHNLFSTSIIQDTFNDNIDEFTLEAAVESFDLKICETSAAVSYAGSLSKFTLFLHCTDHIVTSTIIPLFCGSDHKSQLNIDFFHKTQETNDHQQSETGVCHLLCFIAQFPKDMSSLSVRSVVMISIGSFIICLDPRFWEFFKYHPLIQYVPKMNEPKIKRNQESTSKEGSGLSSETTTLPTESQSKSHVGTSCDSQATRHFCRKHFTQIVTALYPILNRLNIQIDIEGASIVLPVVGISWPLTRQNNILTILRHVFQCKAFPNTLIINLPSVSVTNGGQRNPTIPKVSAIPIVASDGNVVSDHFPWAIKIEHYSILTLTHSKDVNYCLHPGSVSATVAVNSKANPVTSTTLTQLSVCIHCDFHPVRLEISNSQLKVVAEILKKCIDVAPRIVFLFVDGLAMEFIDKVQGSFPELIAPSPSVLPPSQAGLISRKISVTSSCVETATAPASTAVLDHDSIVHLESKGVGHTSKYVSLPETVKVSIWLQVTVPKLSLDVINNDAGQALRLNFELEDISSSVDIQEVYSKVKFKVASFNATHYRRMHDTSDWELGPYEGITVCTGDRLTKTLHVANPKTGMKSLCPHSSFLERDDTHGSFLLITFTRAECKNVQKRWAKILRDCSGAEFTSQVREMCEKSSSSAVRHISEIDLKLASFDVIFWAPLIGCVLRAFDPLFDVLLSLATPVPSPLPLELQPQHSQVIPETQSMGLGPQVMPRINASSIPLLYFTCGTIRLFFPKTAPNLNVSLHRECGTEHVKSKNIHRLEADLLVLQIVGINIASNADNPLSRVLLKPDVYNIAQRAGILAIPGSEVEDRQYQVDITGLSLHTGSWMELMEFTKRSLPSTEITKLKTMGENPAFEWNTKCRSEPCDSIFEVILCPLVGHFDFRVIVAPAIIYERGGYLDEAREDVLVAGHSLEVNATTDIDFFIGIHQLQFIHEQIRTTLAILRFIKPENDSVLHDTSLTEDNNHSLNLQRGNVKDVRDSGIESEASTFYPTGSGQHSILRPTDEIVCKRTLSILPVRTSEHLSRPVVLPGVSLYGGRHFTPFELLLTAGHITVSFYSPEHSINLSERVKISKVSRETNNTGSAVTRPVSRKVDPVNEDHSSSTERRSTRRIKSKVKHRSAAASEIVSEMAGYEGSEESVDGGSGDEGTDITNAAHYHIVPLFYFVFSQPYTLLKFHYDFQKFEMSCFNIQLKGSSLNRMLSYELVLKPEYYDILWFETLPGDADAKTGIPPALYTLTILNFLNKPDITLKIERPLTIYSSTEKYNYFRSCFDSFIAVVLGAPLIMNTTTSEVSPQANEQQTTFLEMLLDRCHNSLTSMGKMSIQTQQFVIVYETESVAQNAGLILCFNQIFGSAEFKPKRSDFLDKVEMQLCLAGCILQTRLRHVSRTILGPLTSKVMFMSVWNDWNVHSILPNFIIKVDTDVLLINIDQQHITCLSLIADHLKTVSHTMSNTSYGIHNTPTSPDFFKLMFPTALKSYNTQSQVWHDDLRVGVFQYTQDSDDRGVLPGPNEIVFCKENGGKPASMTWKYPQPRALTRIEIHPVPFRAASEASVRDDFEEKVQCALQYWDDLQDSFVSYRIFQLSETQHCVLDVPPVSLETCKDLIVCHMWRVVMDYVDPSDEGEVSQPHRGLVSPLALAACMRVDSFFSPDFVPFMDCLLSCNLLKITLTNYFPLRGEVPLLRPYKFDNTLPEYQEFIIFTTENLTLRGRHWYNTCMWKINFISHLELLDYKFLTLQSLIEPFSVTSQISTVQDAEKGVMEASVDFGAIYFLVCQSAVHTLTLGLRAWREEEDSRACCVMNYYVICNGTQETLRFGQLDTDENITIGKYQAHAYSWRTHRSRQVLHVCVEGMKWKWCDPFSIDEVGVQVRIIENKGRKVTLIIEVKKLNSLQKKVVISGQLIVSNRLERHLEVKLKSLKFTALSDSEYGIREVVSILEPMSVLPSFIVQHEDMWVLQTKIKGAENNWSNVISIDGCEMPDGSLVKVSSKDSGRILSFWCHIFSNPIGPTVRKLVIFSPLYVIRTHLPSPLSLEVVTLALGQMNTFEVNGRGYEHQIFCPGEPDLTHQLSFRLSHECNVSSPALPLSPSMIQQAAKLPPASIDDFEDLCSDWNSPLPFLWPYENEELERDTECIPKHVFGTLTKDCGNYSYKAINFHQPNINLEVCLTQRWPGCQTLLIDVKPWGLLINKTDIDIILNQNDDVVIPVNGVFPLPKLEGTFKIGIFHTDSVHYSNNIELKAEDWSLNRYWPKVHGVLPKNGHVCCAIVVKESSTLPKVCYLTIRASEKEGIRIFSVHPSYTIVNDSRWHLTATPFVISNRDVKVHLNPEEFTNLDLQVNKIPTPVLFWDMIFSTKDEKDYDWNADDYTHYVKFRESSSDALSSLSWSSSLHIAQFGTPELECTYSVVVPSRNRCNDSSVNDVSRPFRLTSHCFKGSYYFVIMEDEYPQLKLHNNCNFALHYGQGVPVLPEGSEFVMHEESEHVYELPFLGSCSTTYYTFPMVARAFPDIFDLKIMPKLHLAEVVQCNSPQSIGWSVGINVLLESDQFLNVPNCGDIKVHIEKIVAVTHVFFDSVNRVEVSAKEIRSRIKIKSSPERKSSSSSSPSSPPAWRKAKLIPLKIGPTEVALQKSDLSISKEKDLIQLPQCNAVSSKDMHSAKGDFASSQPPYMWNSSAVSEGKPGPLEARTTCETRAKTQRPKVTLYYCQAYAKHICIIFSDNGTEILRANIDEILITSRPLLDLSQKLVTVMRQEVLFCASEIQIDNQLHVTGGYDFPVVFVSRAFLESSDCAQIDHPPMHFDLMQVRRNSLITLAAVLQRSSTSKSWYIQNVELGVKPFVIYLEDALLHAVSQMFRSCQMSSLCYWSKDVLSRDRVIPQQVLWSAINLGSPVTIQRFTILPISLMFSLHASLKLFISLDHTPLNFRSFEKEAFSTTWYRLGHALAMHYLSGALIRAGWVVGSLDLLGNPGGFARAISAGMMDFFFLPYQGLMQGPWAFITGVTQGSSSLFRHITSGTLISITNLASSISRNMDRLSFDKIHLERNEELRRCPPIGVTRGLSQGLTGFGISLLGAIAGIVDQPFQSVQDVADQGMSPSRAAANVISGVSKGLVGIMTKPLGGAAEFVAQTGQGILHGAGWVKVLKSRYQPTDEDTLSYINSHLKYRWKMLPECSPQWSVFTVEATHVNASGKYIAAILLLTPEVLFVVSLESDTQQQAFPLAELDCKGHDMDPTLVYFLPREILPSDFMQPEEKNRDRVTEFIIKSSKYLLGHARNEESDSMSDSFSLPSKTGPVTVATRFYINPRLRDTFLTLYLLFQRKVLGKGYPI